MNPRIRDLWLAALRGDVYQQGTGALRAQDGLDRVQHCCLGVLCEIHGRETNQGWEPHPSDIDDDGQLYDYLGMCEILPPEVVAWAGLDDEDPIVHEGPREMSLSQVNDNGTSFLEIANLIEEWL